MICWPMKDEAMVARMTMRAGRILSGLAHAVAVMSLAMTGVFAAGAVDLDLRQALGLPQGAGVVLAMQETTAAQDEFVPIDELPPEDRLPAAPFLVGAYTVTLILMVGYVWLLWRRLEVVRRELHEARAAAHARPPGRAEAP